MRLADFIDRHAEDILAEWEQFASTKLPAASSMETLALRDHAPLILQAIAADLRTAQSAEQQRSKAEGMTGVLVDAPSTAAQAHGAARAQSGFNLNQMVSEYRALRASVLRLWTPSRKSEDQDVVEDIIRFNEQSIRPLPNPSITSVPRSIAHETFFSECWVMSCETLSMPSK